MNAPPRRRMPKELKRSGQHAGSRPEAHDPLRPVAVRTHAEPPDWIPPGRTRAAATPLTALVMHTVPLAASGEPLAFAVWAIIDETLPGMLDVGIILGAELSAADRQRLVEDAAAAGIGQVDEQHDAGELLYRIVYQRRAVFAPWDLIVDTGRLCSDWGTATKDPFRGGVSLILSTKHGEPTSRRPLLRDGRVEFPQRSRLGIRSIDSVRSLAGFTFPAQSDRRDRTGIRTITSIRVLAEALTGTTLGSINDAATAFNIPTSRPHESGKPDGRLEAAVTALDTLVSLYRVLICQHRNLAPGTRPHAALSPGSYVQALFQQAGLDTPLHRQPDFDRGVLAAWSGAYFAGDVFCRLRHRHLPVHTLDFGGLYPVAFRFTDSWDLYAAQRIRVHPRDPEQTRRWLARIARRIRRWLGGSTVPPLTARDWRRLARTLVWIKPDADVLPHRPVTEGAGSSMSISPLTSHRTLPYVLADVLAAVLRTGAVPEITSAHRLVPWEHQTLEPVVLPTGREVDPNMTDPVFELATERARLEVDPGVSTAETQRLSGLLKGMASAAASGLPIQVLDDEPAAEPRPMHWWDPLTPGPSAPIEGTSQIVETPGRWYFPPIASGVTASARLLLLMARLAFEHAGATVAYWDTDSLHVVADAPGGTLVSCPGGQLRTPDGRPAVATISHRTVWELRWKIEQLSPYPAEVRPRIPDLSGDLPTYVDDPRLLRSEPENIPPISSLPMDGLFLDVNRSKRPRPHYIERPGPHIEIHEGIAIVVEPSSEDLRRLSQVRMANPSHHGITYLTPRGVPEDWVDQQFAAHLNEYHGFDKPVPEWGSSIAISAARATRPVMIKAHPSARPGSTLGITRGLLSGQAITALPNLTGWVNPETRRRITLGTDPTVGLQSDFERARSINDEFRRNVRQAQPNAIEAATGKPAGKSSSGVLEPAPTVVTSVQLIGREARRWRDGRGTFEPPETVIYNIRTDPAGLVALLREHFNWRGAAPMIAKATGLPERTVREILAGRRTPSTATLFGLHHFAVQQRLIL